MLGLLNYSGLIRPVFELLKKIVSARLLLPDGRPVRRDGGAGVIR